MKYIASRISLTSKLFKQHEAELGYLRDRCQLFPADIELIFKLLGEPQYYDRYVLNK